MEHRFTGPSYTLGIEEELMIVDEETLDLVNSIERLLADLRDVPTEGEVKPELMESVCEIATTPVNNTVEAGAQLRAMRRTVNEVAQRHGPGSDPPGRTRSRSGRTSGSSRDRATET